MTVRYDEMDIREINRRAWDYARNGVDGTGLDDEGNYIDASEMGDRYVEKKAELVDKGVSPMPDQSTNLRKPARVNTSPKEDKIETPKNVMTLDEWANSDKALTAEQMEIDTTFAEEFARFFEMMDEETRQPKAKVVNTVSGEERDLDERKMGEFW